MKKILMTALVCAPIFLMAQTKPAATPPAKDPAGQKDPMAKTMTYTPEIIFAEMIVSESNNKTNIRVDFGRDIMDLITDKDLETQLTELRNMPFTTVADALNYTSSQGWKLVTTYMLNTQNLHETRLVLEKRLMKKPGMGVDGNSGGMQRPPVTKEPPARPADPGRPATPGKEKGKE